MYFFDSLSFKRPKKTCPYLTKWVPKLATWWSYRTCRESWNRSSTGGGTSWLRPRSGPTEWTRCMGRGRCTRRSRPVWSKGWTSCWPGSRRNPTPTPPMCRSWSTNWHWPRCVGIHLLPLMRIFHIYPQFWIFWFARFVFLLDMVTVRGVRCSSVVRAFTHGAMGRRIDPSWGGPIELFLVPASVPRLV